MYYPFIRNRGIMGMKVSFFVNIFVGRFTEKKKVKQLLFTIKAVNTPSIRSSIQCWSMVTLANRSQTIEQHWMLPLMLDDAADAVFFQTLQLLFSCDWCLIKLPNLFN